MDINFKCRHCEQDLSIDASGAGSEIQCPACGGTILIPSANTNDDPSGGPKIVNPISTSAGAKEVKHFVVPQREKTEETLIAKPLKSLEAAAHEAVILRTKCIRHFDCVEVGKDHFDEVVTNFINKVGEANIVKIETFNYSHRDLETRDWVTDYGIFILYRG
ncbi:MAG: hypothetical protein IPK15_14410 [Verrucomicrobia bacterium]|nr:hypothetical protein [Verrucomicrobiota bacterium]